MAPAGAVGDGRPSFAAGDDVPPLRNEQLARIFHEIADVLEIKGELAFKIGAYRRAADSIAHTPVDVVAAYRAGTPPRLEGVGKAIDEKLAELADTGRLDYHEQLLAEVPPSLVTLLAVPGIGPRTAGDLWRALGVATLADLETAAREGRLREVKGISAKTEQRILDGLGELETRPASRMHMAEARDVADRLALLIGTYPGVRSVTAAGSVRRGRENVGDLDLLVETDQAAEVLSAVRTMAATERVVAGLRGGEHRVSVQLLRGPQADVMTYPPGRGGTYRVHFTGSAAHNVRLRERARDLGWSLSEHGFARLDASGSVLAGADADVRTFATETEVYGFLGMPFIEPELREDRGEIEAALAGRLPSLVRVGDLQGDCHTHSEWSDGKESIETMAEAGRRRGYAYQVLTDHSWSLTIANGLSPAQVEQERLVIRELNERFAREEAAEGVPEGAHPSGFRLLHGCELEIRTDGRLDYDDELLARFDVVVASLHVGRKQPRAQLMARYETALRNPHVDIIAHPSGRKIDQRPDLDLDWEAFYRLAAET
ncbi:MAG: DNA polymerase/3'-5' exonuclease PolX, partial [Chloroflexi bacterium]|nr:DNA polymerase/3'-5' exonuclease PolX [Chloroflexota bacterium]